jgi:hypothetical protein
MDTLMLSYKKTSMKLSYFFNNVVNAGSNHTHTHILGWCLSWCSFCLRRIFSNKNCTLAICNISFYSFCFPLSKIFGILRF